MKLGALTAATLVSLGALAHAQPSAPSERVAPSTPQAKSPKAAVGLSVLGTVVPLLMIGTAVGLGDGTPEGHMPLYLAGMTGTFIGPSIGHWYAGEVGTAGLLGRGLGAGLIGVGAAMSLNCLGSPDASCEPDRAGEVIAVAGIALYAGSTIYDIATAGRAAKRWNLAHVQVAPTLVGGAGHSTLGLGISGRF